MALVAGIDSKKLEKTTLILGLEDVLVPGQIDPKIKIKDVKQILQNLVLLEQKVPGFRFFIITGYTREKGVELLKKHGLYSFCSEQNCFFVTPEYLASKEPVDRELHEKALQKDPNFKDEFLKQITIDKLSQEYHIPKSKMVLIGHDLWFGGFYTMRFSQIDFALIRSALSLRHEKYETPIKGLTYINRTWADIKKLLLGKFPKADYSFLNAFVDNFLRKELISPQTMGAILDAKRKHDAQRQN